MASKKYSRLGDFLKAQTFEAVPITFSAIEAIIGDRLPPSARKHRAWWSNNPGNAVITYEWLGAGYRSTDVSMDEERLTFRRA